MEKKLKKNENTLHLGGDFDAEFVKQFRKQAEKRKFNKSEIIRLLIEWWISLDEGSQRNFYYQEIDPLPENIRTAINEHVNNLLLEYKLISAEPEPESSGLDEFGRGVQADLERKPRKKYREDPKAG